MRLPKNSEFFSIIVTIVLAIVLAIGVLGGWWTLGSILSFMPEIILISIAGVLVWGFRKRIEGWFYKDKEKPSYVPIKVSELRPKDYVKQETSPPKPKQPSINEGIQHYEKRSDLPFDEMVFKADKKIEMSAITFRIITLNNYNTLRGLLSRKVSITFLLLKPDSKVDQSMLYHGSEDLNEQIPKSFKELCKLKTEFGDLIDIRLYDSLSEHSIVVIDRDDADKAWIQVESHVIGSDPNSRPINVAYEKDNQAFFYQYSKEYDKLFNDSEPYQCPSP